MMNHYRPGDYRTARTLNEAFGPYADLQGQRRKNPDLPWHLAAAALVALLVVVLVAGALS